MAGLAFDILARDKASPAFDKVSRSVEKTEKKFGFLAARTGGLTAGMTAGFGKIAGAMVAVASVQVFKGFIEEARESRKVGALTESIIKSTGGAAKVSAKQVGALAEAISNKTGVDDEAIQSGANLLLTFKNVRNEVGKGANIFDRATQAAVDLSAAGFGDVAGASKMLGKALNDPLKGLTALGKAGVTFTEDQKKQIATLVETGKTLEAQKIILKEVESQVGGAAAASADPMARLSVVLGNVKETIGTAFLPAIDKVASFLSDKIPSAVGKAAIGFKALKSAFEEGDVTSDGFVGAMERIGATAGRIVDAFRGLGGRLARAIGPVDVSGIGKKILTDAAGWAKNLISGFKTGVQTGNWKPLGTAVGDAVVAALQGAASTSGKLLDAIGAWIDSVDWGRLGRKISTSLTGMLQGVDWGRLGSVIGDTIVSIVRKSTDLGQKVGTAIREVVTKVDWRQVGRDSTDAIGQFISGVDWGKLAKTLGIMALKSLKISKEVYDSIIFSAGRLVEGMIGELLKEIEKGRLWVVAKTKELGGWLWAGLKAGVVAGAKGIGGWLKSVIVDPVINSVKGFFGVRSPSTVFAKIGSELLAGLRAGVAAGARGIGSWMYRTVIVPVVTPFMRAGTWLVSHGRNAVAGFKAGVSAIASGIGRWMYDRIISPSVAPFNKAGTWLVKAGRNVIAGFKNGMTQIWGQVTTWVSGIATWIRNNKGPVSLDGQLLIPAGRAIMSGFLKGLKSGAGPAWNFVKSVGGKTVDALRNEAFLPADVAAGVLGGPNRRVFYQGEALDAGTYGKLVRAMRMVGAVNVTQGSYERASSYSGSTHTGGGVFDVVGGNLTRIMSSLKASGLIGWIRNPSQGPWPYHIHALDPSETGRMSASARAQVADYYRGGNGLAGYLQGTPWVPNDGLAHLHEGEAVLPRKVNEARIAASRSSAPSTVILRIETGGSRMDDFLAEMIRRYVKINGGDVQRAFGS